MTAAKSVSLDSILDNLDASSFKAERPVKLVCVAFWLPEDCKTKYDILQDRTNLKFGKFLKEMIKKSIEKSIDKT